MVDLLRGILEAGEDVVRFQERVVFENLLARRTAGEHVQHVLDDSYSAAHLPPKTEQARGRGKLSRFALNGHTQPVTLYSRRKSKCLSVIAIPYFACGSLAFAGL